MGILSDHSAPLHILFGWEISPLYGISLKLSFPATFAATIQACGIDSSNQPYLCKTLKGSWLSPRIHSGERSSRNAQLPEARKTEILATASLAWCQPLDQGVRVRVSPVVIVLAQGCGAASAMLLNLRPLSQVLRRFLECA